MRAGLDIGSRTVALVDLEGDSIVRAVVVETGVDPVDKCERLLQGKQYDALVATGYGRHLAGDRFAATVVSEIAAHAAGAGHLCPDCHTVIDIGGQDSKVIAVDRGQVMRFEMNDRCAAGTGRFLEAMASIMGMGVGWFGEFALGAEGVETPVSSMCTVFAESEVVSLIARGGDGPSIALGLHRTVAQRIANMVRRVGARERVVFCGGVALNRCMQRLLSEAIGVPVSVPADPQIIGALGAALRAGGRASIGP